MKHLGLLLGSVVIIFAAAALGLLAYLTEEPPAQDMIVVPVDPTISALEQALAEQTAAYQAQLTELEQSRQQREAELQRQFNTLTDQIAAAHQQLAELKHQEQELLSQLDRLEAERAGQLAAHQTRLQQTQAQSLARQSELQNQLATAQAELDQVEAQLAR